MQPGCGQGTSFAGEHGKDILRHFLRQTVLSGAPPRHGINQPGMALRQRAKGSLILRAGEG